MIFEVSNSAVMPGSGSSLAAHYVPDFAAAVAAVAGGAREGDMIMTLGAGSVSQLAPQILAELESKS